MIIEKASQERMAHYLGFQAVYVDEAWAAVADGVTIAMGGFVTVQERTFAFFDTGSEIPASGMRIVRAMMRVLHDKNRTVYVQCDEGYRKAGRLLKAIGFVPTEEVMPDARVVNGDNLRVWKWEPWPI